MDGNDTEGKPLAEKKAKKKAADGNVTLEDIARTLEVSKTTVSRAISGKGRIGNPTRDRILQYIERIGYRPNIQAKGLAKRKTYNIALVWPGDYYVIDMYFFRKCLLGINRVAVAAGYDILIALMEEGDISELKRIVNDKKVDGVILTRTLVQDAAAGFLAEVGMPFVAIGSSDIDGVIRVDNDHFGACRELTMRLLKQGIRRLALVGGNPDHMITGLRRQGYLKAFEEMKITVDPSLIYIGMETYGGMEGIIKDLTEKQADGVICMDDSLTSIFISKCKDLGIRIPEDMKVASFYNSPVLELTTPAVTSLEFDDICIGAKAAEMIIDLVRGKDVKEFVSQSYKVMWKESTI